MNYIEQVREKIRKVLEMSHAEGKLSGFCIGNTAKIDLYGLYLTPIRNTKIMVVAGVIVYSEKQAIEIAKEVDGKVDYILVDAEKKVPDNQSRSGGSANVERAVRETVKRSKLWVYKGNDLAVEAIDTLLTHLTKDTLRGIGGKKIAILGTGNLGCKLALMLVERGGHVYMTRRNIKKLKVIVKALNYMKPRYTVARIRAITNNEKAAKGAEILIGATGGIPVITSKMLKQLAPGALVIEAGKGTFYPSALGVAEELNLKIFRLDITAVFEGLISKLFAIENIINNCLGRRNFNSIPIVSGGILGRKGEIVVDNINDPKIVYGIADGNGDFIREPSGKYAQNLENINKLIEEDKYVKR